ncbi:Serine/threonine protein kinase [Phytophthora megakarya]|uniref:Serine/threonine protein kinase n=1 Tax=Phytophthora megakarya TaxID=4795 RepID=A0A225UYS7_9STRA|nr:Serine/threonine protein kinase [Phytophthora megakarya]
MVGSERGGGFQTETLRDLVNGAAPRMLVGEMRSERFVTKAMLDMFLWLEADTPGDLDALKRETLDRLRVTLGLVGRIITSDTVTQVDDLPKSILPILRWFIFERDLTIIGEPIGSGSSGVVNRAEWRQRDGTIRNTITKMPFYESAGSEVSLLKQLQFWYELPTHANIVKLYEAKAFFVCEDAHNGDIVTFFAIAEKFFEMFLQVAKRLEVLHEHHIVHNGLKGSNNNNIPKISDFACSTIRVLSAQTSKQTQAAQGSSVRWKPREKLVEAIDGFPQFKQDIYPLGMCMVDTLTQDTPFGMDKEDNEFIEEVVGDIPYECPANTSDEE